MTSLRGYLLPGIFVIGAAVLGFTASSDADGLSTGQTIYVSVYSNILTAPRGIPYSLEPTLVIRNTDMTNSVNVTTADFYDTQGALVKSYVASPMTLQPLETKYIYLPEKGHEGGLGANFIIRWSANRAINPPIIECLMIGAKSSQGISFITHGKVIEEHPR